MLELNLVTHQQTGSGWTRPLEEDAIGNIRAKQYANLTAAILWLSNSTELSLLVKATLVLAAALAAAALARRARASARHLVVATAFAALVALPILIASIPAIAPTQSVSMSPNFLTK